jgi:hypothetical protein
MKAQLTANIVRRSIALPRKLVEEAKSAAPPELKENFNRLVIVALEDFAAHRRKQTFEEAMNQMGDDPEIKAQCQTIVREFAETERDGLAIGN